MSGFPSRLIGGTHQFDKRYFSQNGPTWLHFCTLSSLSLFFVAILDEIEFEHFGDGGRRHPRSVVITVAITT